MSPNPGKLLLLFGPHILSMVEVNGLGRLYQQTNINNLYQFLNSFDMCLGWLYC